MPMVCAVKSNSAQVGLASMKADMHGLIETAPTSGNSSARVYFQKRKIKSLSVLIDGQIVNTYEESAPGTKIHKDDKKPEKIVPPKVEPRKSPAVSPAEAVQPESLNQNWYYLAGILLLLAIASAFCFTRKPKSKIDGQDTQVQV